MSTTKKTPAVVAELGRPETPQETASRKAQNSRDHRERQTVTNLIYALIATVGVVLIIVMLVPRATPTGQFKHVDYGAVAAQGAGTEPDPLVDPKLPSGYYSNSAQLNQDSGSVDSWYIGLITPSKQYLAVEQGFNANPTWVAEELKDVRATGTKRIDGVTWTVYDARKAGTGTGNVQYALTSASGASTYVLYGTASDSEFARVAEALAPDIMKNGVPK
jgi:hypothetical protein